MGASESSRSWRTVGLAVCLFLGVGMCVTSCQAPPPEAPPSRLGVQPEIQQVLIDAHTRLITAYESHDVEGFVALLDPSLDMLLFHPLSEARFDSIDEVREKLPRMFAKVGEVTWTDAHPMVIQRGGIAWITSNFVIDSPSLAYHLVGRGTEIWVHDGTSWKLIHGHWSQQPSTAPSSGS